MQKAPRITVQKRTRKEQQSPSDTDASSDTSRVGTGSLCAARPKMGGSTRDRTRVNPWRGRRARPCRQLVPVVVPLEMRQTII